MTVSTWVARALAGAAALALISGLGACSTAAQAGAAKPAQSPAAAPPSTAPASASPSAVDYDQLALDELDKIVNGSDQVTSGFDDTMRQRLSAEQVGGELGRVPEAVRELPVPRRPGGRPARCAHRGRRPADDGAPPRAVRVTFDPDGHIAGLFLLKSGTPVS